MPQRRYATAHDLAKHLQAAATVALDPLVYNRYHAEDSAWWLLPRAERVSRHRAKFAVWPADAGFLVGWGVEKGVGPSEAPRFVHVPHEVLSEGWAWHRALSALRDGSLVGATERAMARSAQPPLAVVLSAHDHAGDVRGTHDLVWPILPGGALGEARETRSAERPLLYERLAEADSFAALAALLHVDAAAVPFDRIWLDLYFARTYLARAPLDPERVWRDTLEPFSDLLWAPT